MKRSKLLLKGEENVSVDIGTRSTRTHDTIKTMVASERATTNF